MVSYFDLDLEEFTLVVGIWYCKQVDGMLNPGTEIGQWKIEENKTVKLSCDVYMIPASGFVAPPPPPEWVGSTQEKGKKQ